MQRERTLQYISWFMYCLNFIIVVFLSGIAWFVTTRLCGSFGARAFLDHITELPLSPRRMVVYSIGLYGAMVALSIGLRHSRFLWKHSHFCILLETILCVLLMFVLGMSYSGMVFIVIADFVFCNENRRVNVVLISVMIAMYLFSDHHLISLCKQLVSFQDYIVYFTTQAGNYLMGIKSILTSMNILAFFLFMICQVGKKSDQNARISELNVCLDHANRKLAQSNLQLREYALRTEKMIETRERNRVAREIHDTLGHALTGIAAASDACLMTVDSSPEIAKKQLQAISDTARKGLTDVRRSVHALRPDALERLKLKSALRALVREAAQNSGAEISLQMDPNPLQFSADEDDVIYRIVQESVTNAIRHGKANRIDIILKQEENKLTIQIQDNGLGCINIIPGFGLQHMKERLSLLGGTVRFDGLHGFLIQAVIPIRWGDTV